MLLSTGLRQEVSTLKDRIATTSLEAVTGRYADLTTHLSGRIGSAMLSQKAIDDIGAERVRLTLRESRLDLSQRTLEVLQTGADGLAARMQSAIGSGNTASQWTVAADAKAVLQQTFSLMNTRHGERFLFAGDATDTPPFAAVETFLDDVRTLANAAADPAAFETALDDYFNTPGAGWQANIYRGTATGSDPEAVNGMNPALTDMFRSLAVFALGGQGENIPLIDNNPDILITASEKLVSGQTDLVTLRSALGVFQGQIADRKETLDMEEVVLTRTFNEMTARDQYEAAAELTELETNLEASYALTARLSGLSLLNFIR
ncbi:MAG: hypothetical protein KDA53_15575 [Hyphomonas sp.]|nr:hypothetical protein [Hyphomonas sp.]